MANKPEDERLTGQNRGDYSRQAGTVVGANTFGLANAPLGNYLGNWAGTGFGKIGGKKGRGGAPIFNPGNVAAMPYSQKYGGEIARSIAANPNISKQELEQMVLQQEEADARARQEALIAGYFDDPTRTARYNQEYDAELNAAKEQLGQATQAGMRNAAQMAASRGLQQGSVDIENRVGLAGRYQGGLSELAARRQQAGQMQKMQDINAKTSLVGMVNAADPFSQQATQSRLQGLAGQGRAAQGYIQAGLTRDMADETGANLMSQAYGQGLSGLAGGFKTWQDRNTRQYGGQEQWK